MFHVTFRTAEPLQVWGELKECGFFDDVFVPQYAETHPESEIRIGPINDTLWAGTLAKPIDDERNKRSSAEYDWHLRGAELVNGETLLPELQLTRSNCPSLEGALRQHLHIVERGETLYVNGNSKVFHRERDKEILGHFFRYVNYVPFFWAVPLMHLDLAIHDFDGPATSVDIYICGSAWLNSGVSDDVFSHGCRFENWRRLFRVFRRIAESTRIDKSFDAFLGDEAYQLVGLEVIDEFRALPAATHIIDIAD